MFKGINDWISMLFDGMDTPDGALFGSLSLTTTFFPFFNSFLHIFPPPKGWSWLFDIWPRIRPGLTLGVPNLQ